jgi:outer membrane protein
MRRQLVLLGFALSVLAPAGPAAAQSSPAAQGAGAPPIRLTFAEAIARAVKANPSVEQAANDILRAQALLDQASAVIKPVISGAVTATTLNKGVTVNGAVATPQNQQAASLVFSAPVFAPVQWAQRVQAADSKHVTELAAADVRTQVSVAAAQAYIAIMGRRRVLEAQVRARETALAHYEFARQRRESGAGTRLNELRAQQQVSADSALVEAAGADLYRAEEALGVLVAADGPATAVDDPLLETPAEANPTPAGLTARRPDLILAQGRERAAARVLSDSWKDWLPSVTAIFQPQVVHPGTTFQPADSWRLVFAASVPVFDFGFRRARKAEREVDLNAYRINERALERQAMSEVRTSQVAVAAAERALVEARAAAQQAREVVGIVDVSFKVGAATNIEVIDAQRVSRDTDTAVALAEYDVRTARLNLLVALGLFPGN